MLLTLSEQSPEPLHGQISRQIRARILAGRLAPGSGLPSIRVLARDQRVSVITVKRAYADLEHEGLIHARPGKGFYITPITGGEKERLALDRLRETLKPVLHDARSQGLERKQVHKVLDELFEETGEP